LTKSSFNMYKVNGRGFQVLRYCKTQSQQDLYRDWVSKCQHSRSEIG
jgi:hypothetical protein